MEIASEGFVVSRVDIFEESAGQTELEQVLLLYLINKGEVNELGIAPRGLLGNSGTTGVACMNTNRKFIGIELDEGYFKIANGRIVDAYNKAQETSGQPYIYALNFNRQLTKGNKMLYFSSMTAEEFLNANQQEIPEQVINCFKEFKEKISELESKLKVLSQSEELAWEQVSFARDLIEQLDNFSENELSKPKQKMYNLIRENSYFEV